MTRTIQANTLRGKIHLAVITIREDEFEAVLSRLPSPQPVVGGSQCYEYCRLQRPDGQGLHIAVTRSIDQGQTYAQSTAHRVIKDLSPRWLALVGIAGGVPDDDFSLGDVLLASTILDFSVSSAIESEPPQLRSRGGAPHREVESLLALLPAWRDRLGNWGSTKSLGMAKPQLGIEASLAAPCYYGSETHKQRVQSSLRKHFPSPGEIREPRFHIGAVATSNTLVKDTDLLSRWQQAAKQITHIEMELGGVYLAAKDGPEGELPLLSIRGISDIVGFSRSGDWTKYACNTAAAFLLALASHLPSDTFRQESERSSRFLREVLDRLPTFSLRLLGGLRQLFSFAIDTLPTSSQRSSRRSPTTDEILRAFEASSAHLLSRVVPTDQRLPRAEYDTLMGRLGSEQQSTVLCVLGAPGSGKTALMALFAQEAAASGVATLAIKADLVPAEGSFEAWSESNLGLGLSAIDAVRVIAGRQSVLVVVDQLDALSSTIDLTSDRLDAVLGFIDECSRINGVAVVCSCRSFDYRHDARVEALGAETIELELPAWSDVQELLTKRGITDAAELHADFRELLRNPQYLSVYTDRYAATGVSEPFHSYHLLLDDFWDRVVVDATEKDALRDLTSYLIDHEELWAPAVAFSHHRDAFSALAGKNLLLVENSRVGFCHQTLLEHAKARLFTLEGRPFSQHVIERQNAVFVRPTVWAVLTYLRDANPSAYQREIERLFSADLRLHLRYLLIEFLGQVADPQDYEIAIMGACLLRDDDRVRALLSIRGRFKWFEALFETHLPAVMRGDVGYQWPVIGVIEAAWRHDRDACLGLIEAQWISDPTKDPLCQRAMGHLTEWDERATQIVLTLINRAEGDGDRFWWAEAITYQVSEDQPTLAPQLFVAAARRLDALSVAAGGGTSSRRSQLDSSQYWYNLPDVAEAAPVEFLQAGWDWLVETCESSHRGYASTVVNHYGGSCFAFDDEDGHPKPSVLHAFQIAIEAVGKQDPAEFVRITRPSWESENSVVHRFVIRGLCEAAEAEPESCVEYLLGDSRRFLVGPFTDDSRDSQMLIRAIAPRLPKSKLQQLEDAVFGWSQYRYSADPEGDQLIWDRESRLRLLNAIGTDLLSEVGKLNVEQEEQNLPGWDRQRDRPVRAGFVHRLSPIAKEKMLQSSNEEILKAIEESPTEDGGPRTWVEVDGGFQEPGGAKAAGREVAELIKEDPSRAMEIIEFLVREGSEEAAAEAVHGLADSQVSDSESLRFLESLCKLGPKTNELRECLAYAFNRRSRSSQGLPDHVCELFATWLGEWGGYSDADTGPDEEDFERDSPSNEESVLWGHSGLVSLGSPFFLLAGLTNGYLNRSPPACGAWLDALRPLFAAGIPQKTWYAFLLELRWIRLNACDKHDGASLLLEFFESWPALLPTVPGLRLIAHTADLFSAEALAQHCDSLRQSKKAWGKQGFGELLVFIAFQEQHNPWASDLLEAELTRIEKQASEEDDIALGFAFAAAHLWDVTTARAKSSQVLCRLVPNATERVATAVSTVFWTEVQLPADEHTEALYRACADNPVQLRNMHIASLVEQLAPLTVHMKQLSHEVCRAILDTRRDEQQLFEAGADLVSIAMTLQRFSETREDGLALLEDMLRLGLDDAFSVLRDIDVRPTSGTPSPKRVKRRRRKR